MTVSHVLLLRASGPLQAWGVESRFSVRDTGREPSKSGIIGLLCAALGRNRDDDITDLAALRMGVRADQEGTILRDFHVAGVGGYYKASGAVERDNVIPGNRYYMMDARFLVGFEGGDLELLNKLHAALRDPHWMLFLGRKACVPGEPVWLADGLRENATLVDTLAHYPWLVPGRIAPAKRPVQLRAVIEEPEGEQVRPDQPLSFSENNRSFAPRKVHTVFWDIPPVSLEEVTQCTSRA